jgi:hypothetical protein
VVCPLSARTHCVPTARLRGTTVPRPPTAERWKSCREATRTLSARNADRGSRKVLALAGRRWRKNRASGASWVTRFRMKNWKYADSTNGAAPSSRAPRQSQKHGHRGHRGHEGHKEDTEKNHTKIIKPGSEHTGLAFSASPVSGVRIDCSRFRADYLCAFVSSVSSVSALLSSNKR